MGTVAHMASAARSLPKKYTKISLALSARALPARRSCLDTVAACGEAVGVEGNDIGERFGFHGRIQCRSGSCMKG